MSTSTVEENTTGVASISDQAVQKIFYGEIELMLSIRGMIDASTLDFKRKTLNKTVQRAQLDAMLAGFNENNNLAKMKGPARARAEISLCENYFIILDLLMDDQAGSSMPISMMTLDLLKRAWKIVKKTDPYCGETIDLNSGRALIGLFQFAYQQDIRFSRLHSQLMAHLALIEYRMKNGWLIGKYDGQWTKTCTDSEIIHKWVGTEGMNLCMPAYRLNVAQVHNQITGKLCTGM